MATKKPDAKATKAVSTMLKSMGRTDMPKVTIAAKKPSAAPKGKR